MADDKHYEPGQFYRIDDRSGFKVRNYRTQKEWTGLIVKDSLYESRPMQDFVKGFRDDQTVPKPRPRQANQFLGPLTTTTTQNALAGASTLEVVSSADMTVGDKIEVILDTGDQFKTTLTAIPTATSITFSPVLTYSAASGALVTDLSVVTSASIG